MDSPRARAASASGGGAGDGQCRLQPVHRRGERRVRRGQPRRAGRRTHGRHRGPAGPSATSASTSRRGSRGRRLAIDRSPCRRSAAATSARTGDATVGRPSTSGDRLVRGRPRRRAPATCAIVDERAVEVEPRRGRDRVASGDRSREPLTRSASAGAATRRAAARRPAPRRRPGRARRPRRRTNRSPGASAIGAASRTIPAASRPAGQRVAPGPADGGVDRGRPEMQPRARPIRRRWRRNATSSAVRRARHPGSAVRTVAAVELRGVDAGEVERGPARRPRPASTRAAVDLDLADPDGRARPARAAACRRVASGPPRSVPVTTDAAALDREDPVDRQRRRARAGGAPTTASRTARSAARTSSGSPPPLRRRRGDDRRAGEDVGREQPLDAGDDLRHPVRVDRVDLGHDRRCPCAIAERVEQRQMLERLGARPVVGGHDEQRGVDLAGADEHVADEPVVARDVDEVDRRPVVERRGGRSRRRSSCPRRRSSGSRSASMPVSARRSVVLPWSMWPAVPMTTVIAPPASGRSTALARSASVLRVDRPQVEHDPAVLDAADDRRVAPRGARPAAGSPTPARRERQPDRRQRSRRAATPADRRAERRRPSRRRAEPRREGIGPRRAGRRPARRSSARPGCRAVARPARYSPRVAATAAIVTLSGRMARASGSRRIRATRSARPTMSPACGPPTSLSPLNVTRSAPAARRSRRHRLVGQTERARCRAGRPMPRSSMTIAPCAWASVGDGRRIGCLGEPGHREVRRVDPQDDACAGPPPAAPRSRPTRVRFVVPTSIEPRAGAPDDLGDPHATADLDELAAGHDDAAATPGEADGQGHRGGVVVGDERVLGAGQRDEVVLRDPGTRARGGRSPDRARAAGSPCASGRDGRDRGRRPRRPAEVRVDDDPGRVDDRRRGRRRPAPRSRRAARSAAAARPSTGRRRHRPPRVDRAPRRPRSARRRDGSRLARAVEAASHGREDALDARRARSVAGARSSDRAAS